jgi:hypothetical protein
MEEEEGNWPELSDEALQALITCLNDYGRALPEALHSVLDGLRLEGQRRYSRKTAPTYRGPGYYVDKRNGTALHVVGTVRLLGAQHLLVGSSVQDTDLWALPASKIEERLSDGSRMFRYRECL